MTLSRRNFLGQVACAMAVAAVPCRIPPAMTVDVPATATGIAELNRIADAHVDGVLSAFQASYREMMERVLMDVLNHGTGIVHCRDSARLPQRAEPFKRR